jgi:hypothetical protein|tara:strand:+ start:268 stop:480 length:213 start_codon:yes stop_codon:yes gene_type:complete
MSKETEKEIKKRAIKSLTIDQIQAIQDTIDSHVLTIVRIKKFNDQIASDIYAMEGACYQLYHQFNLGSGK